MQMECEMADMLDRRMMSLFGVNKNPVNKLEVQNTLVVQLSKEIEKDKDVQTQGYVNRSGYDDSIQVNLGALAALDSMEMGGGKLKAP